MAYTKPDLDTDLGIIPGEDIETMARRIEAATQHQVAADIARLKAMGNPIHYKIGNKLVREEANGQKFELQIQEDGSEEIISEII
jgi:hypothetical protein